MPAPEPYNWSEVAEPFMNQGIAAFLFFASVPLFAQPATVEAFGMLGVHRVAADEGSLGTGVFYGGALAVPIHRRLAVDVDVVQGRTKREFSSSGVVFRSKQTLVSPSLVARWGSDRAYFFAGGGVGGAFSDGESGHTYVGKAGIVGAISPDLLIRADLVITFQHALPHLGTRVGVGYRF